MLVPVLSILPHGFPLDRSNHQTRHPLFLATSASVSFPLSLSTLLDSTQNGTKLLESHLIMNYRLLGLDHGPPGSHSSSRFTFEWTKGIRLSLLPSLTLSTLSLLLPLRFLPFPKAPFTRHTTELVLFNSKLSSALAPFFHFSVSSLAEHHTTNSSTKSSSTQPSSSTSSRLLEIYLVFPDYRPSFPLLHLAHDEQGSSRLPTFADTFSNKRSSVSSSLLPKSHLRLRALKLDSDHPILASKLSAPSSSSSSSSSSSIAILSHQG